MRRLLSILIVAAAFVAGTPLYAQGKPSGGGGGRQGLSVATGFMALANSTSQGGQGATGSTVLTQTDITWHEGWWAAGAFVQYDKQGTAQMDFGAGPRLELTFEPFYLEFGYALFMKRYFVDRAVAEQAGGATHLGLGVRTALGAGGWYLQSSYKYRTQTIKTQDGRDLDQPITQIDGYPLFGIGVGF